ncbi:MAG: hypothetical protein Tsb0019_16500 [Roseibium sp.]
MTSRVSEQISEIVNDPGSSRGERIDALLKLRDDARALQRAATESPMATGDAGSSGLAEIDRALEKLGHTAQPDADENSAATL